MNGKCRGHKQLGALPRERLFNDRSKFRKLKAIYCSREYPASHHNKVDVEHESNSPHY